MMLLITGGAGYIGAHAALAALRGGHDLVVFDDFSQGQRRSVSVLAEQAGMLGRSFHCVAGELRDTALLHRTLKESEAAAVLHFAAKALVGESVAEPLMYYRSNVAGSISLLDAMAGTSVRGLVFSSTCATYGTPAPEQLPISEQTAQRPINPYGQSKLMVERIIGDVAKVRSATPDRFDTVILRYFNVAGASSDGLLGETHHPETHLIPVILQTMAGHGPQHDNTVQLFGTDYPTPDGTCVRDYIHVEDLVDAHLRALSLLTAGPKSSEKPGGTPARADAEPLALNLGTGCGYSNREIIEACRAVTGLPVTVRSAPRRPGDPPTLVATAAKASEVLGWTPRHTGPAGLRVMVESAWRWMQRGIAPEQRGV